LAKKKTGMKAIMARNSTPLSTEKGPVAEESVP